MRFARLDVFLRFLTLSPLLNDSWAILGDLGFGFACFYEIPLGYFSGLFLHLQTRLPLSTGL